MLVIFNSQSEKNAKQRVRRILDLFADRIGTDAWEAVITKEGLERVRALLKRNATKNTAVSCHWMRSRNRSQLVWIVGDRSRFSVSGTVPVNYTQKKVLHPEWEGVWCNLPVVTAITAMAALLHDWGKASDAFQAKLLSGKSMNTVARDAFRHEWVSCMILKAAVHSSGYFEDPHKDERKWIRLLTSGQLDVPAILQYIKETQDDETEGIDSLPPIAEMLAWIILSHHKLPMVQSKGQNRTHPACRYKEKARATFSSILRTIRSDWGYQNMDCPDSKVWPQTFSFSKGLLWGEAPSWRKMVQKWAGRLLEQYDLIHAILTEPGKEGTLRETVCFSRLCLMLADHYVSSLPHESGWQDTGLWANTDRQKGNVRQTLEEHMVRVARQALQISYQLPKMSSYMDRVYDVRSLRKKSPPPFDWQDKAVSKIREYQSQVEKRQAYFILNMASTGCGKTLANAKLIQAISEDGDSLRYILALGLRSLTLQTGNEYRTRIGLGRDDMAVLIGSSALRELYARDDEEAEESLLPEELIYEDTGSDAQTQFLNLFFQVKDFKGRIKTKTSAKNRAFLYKPVLVATIDHLMGATETIRGGRYILPFLRLLSSDLVIDEIDDFSGKDLFAIARLIHMAGMLGRNVVLSSATIPPDLADGMYRAYRAGLSCYNEFFSEKKTCAAVFCDEFKTMTESIDFLDDSAYLAKYNKFTDLRVKKLLKQPVKRKAEIITVETEVAGFSVLAKEKSLASLLLSDKKTQYFETIKKSIVELHEKNHVTDKRSGKKISFGVVRMANIGPCVELSLYMLGSKWQDGFAPRIMTYHSRQILLLRHIQEKYLDRILNRKNEEGDVVDFDQPDIRLHIDLERAENIVFILVATPVEEIGRDHDFDWAVVEPSSYRSFIQLAGRVLRHRKVKSDVSIPNMGILNVNLRGVQGEKYAFVKPGYESQKHRLVTHDLLQMAGIERLKERIDSIPRIQKNKPLRPETCLEDLEQAVMEDFDNKLECGPQSLNGWIQEYWFMTALPQYFNRFRESAVYEINLIARYDNDDWNFSIYEDSQYKKASASLGIKDYNMPHPMKHRLWICRDYLQALRSLTQPAEEIPEEQQMQDASAKFGEITLPDYHDNRCWFYSDDLGVFPDSEFVEFIIKRSDECGTIT